MNKTGNRRTHGMRKTRFYSVYRGILNRCNDPKNKRWSQYGGRGIKCLWESFEQFRDDMYGTYLIHIKKYGRNDTTIERNNNNQGYSKQNCRWATWNEQRLNRGDRKPLTFRGETMLISEWCRKLDLPLHLVWLRIYRYDWSVERAFSEPKGPTSKRYGKNS